MPTWGQILPEIQQAIERGDAQPFNTIRNKYLIRKIPRRFYGIADGFAARGSQKKSLVHVWIGYGYSSRYKGLSHQST